MSAMVAALATLLVVWVPGAAASRLLRTDHDDALARFAEEIALGLAFWPIVFLLTPSGIVWNAAAARLVFAILAAALAALIARRRADWRRPDRVEATGLVLAALVAWTRIRQIDGIAFPLWVDSVHHTMIVRLLVDGGRLPSSYAPFIPESTFYYHWGFHAVLAFVAWISGMTSADALPRLLLFAGQLLNVLTFFAVYAGAKGLLLSRHAALLAATLATLVSFFPAYYVSWGRYTQLCGLLLFPPLAIFTWRLGRHPSVRRAIVVAALSAGLLLIHVRVAVVFAMLATLLAVLLLMQRRFRGLAWCAMAAAGGIALTSTWLVHVATTPQVRTILAPSAAEQFRWESPNGVPDDLLWAPNNLPLFTLATGGLLALTPLAHFTPIMRAAGIAWWLALVVLLQRRARKSRRGINRRDAWRMAVVVAWVAIVAAAINLDRVGLPRLRVVTNSAAIIMLFLPVSIVGAHLSRWALDELMPPRRRAAVMVMATLVIAALGASTMVHIINPVTLLVTQADRAALTWIRSHTPQSALFAVGVQPWIGGSQVGTDGGYWIPLVAQRTSILPPGLYPWVMPPSRVAAITALLDQWYEAQRNGDARFIETLRREGVTHLYFGPRNRTPIRQAVAGQQSLRRIYDIDGVEIYALPVKGDGIPSRPEAEMPIEAVPTGDRVAH